MPLWTKDTSGEQKAPTWYHGPARENIYATYKGWVKRHQSGHEEVLVALANLDATMGAAVCEANTSGNTCGVYFSNSAVSHPTQGATVNVSVDFSQTVSVLQAVSYTNIATGPFVNGEIITQGGSGATGKVQVANSTVLTVYQGGAKAAGTGLGNFAVTSNGTTQITGGTSGATANISSIARPVLNVSATGGYTSNIVATFVSVGPANNQLVFNFTVPSMTDDTLAFTGFESAQTVPFTGVSNGAFALGDTVWQANATANVALGTIFFANSTQLKLNVVSGAFIITTNANNQLHDANSGAIANAVATISTVAAFAAGDTVTQGNVSGIVATQNSTVITVNNSTGLFTTGLITDANTGVVANVQTATSNSATLYILGQTIGTNTSVNIVGNNAVNATPTWSNSSILPLGAVVAGATANLSVS